jgi:RHS repeat-associated protein
LVTDENANTVSRHDYIPFGEEISANSGGRDSTFGTQDFVNQKFTGKERDQETGLDYFGARYMSSVQGRFTSPDPLWVKADRLVDPQRLNLYAYGRNNPLRFSDPTGMDVSLGNCPGSMTVTQCFSAVQNTVPKNDRSHIHLVKGNGDNGFQKGQYGITVDADYKSSSGNFQALQTAANDHSGVANINIMEPGQAFPSVVGVQRGNNVVTCLSRTSMASTTTLAAGMRFRVRLHSR